MIVRCACGAELMWRLDTVLVGYQDDGEGGWLELRNCPCGSTLAREWWPQSSLKERGERPAFVQEAA